MKIGINWGKKSPVLLELEKVNKEEQKLKKQAENVTASKWKETLEQKIPQSVSENLEKAFCKAFEVIFQKGNPIIEKTYQKEELEKDFQIRDFAVDLKGNRKELKKLRSEASKKNFKNMTLSTVEGAGLGLLGIGLPDIVLFTGMILKGTYETAIHYGFSYDTPQEQMLILKLLEASISRGDRWIQCNAEADRLLEQPCPDTESAEYQTELKQQLKNTGTAFAMDMLAAKFIQGLPVVGIIGGLSNPVYYNRILSYVQLKYRKRYLMQKASQKEI